MIYQNSQYKIHEKGILRIFLTNFPYYHDMYFINSKHRDTIEVPISARSCPVEDKPTRRPAAAANQWRARTSQCAPSNRTSGTANTIISTTNCRLLLVRIYVRHGCFYSLLDLRLQRSCSYSISLTVDGLELDDNHA